MRSASFLRGLWGEFTINTPNRHTQRKFACLLSNCELQRFIKPLIGACVNVSALLTIVKQRCVRGRLSGQRWREGGLGHDQNLYVEGDTTLFQLFEVVMTPRGYAADVATTGADGLSKRTSNP